MTDIQLYHNDCMNILQNFKDFVDVTIADPPYSSFPFINDLIKVCRDITKGASLFFMYGEDLVNLIDRPDQVLYWIKPVSTKNTSKRYSRFVEVIAVYDIEKGPFNETFWSNKTGVFTEQLLTKPLHPYEKPVSLIERLALNHTTEGMTILDPCAGSGTTGVACTRLNRNAVLIEQNKTYFDILTERLGTR